MKYRFLPGLAVAALGSATAADIPPSVPMSGFARYEFNKWLFRPCVGSGKKAALALQGQPIIDATVGGLLFKAIQQRWQQSADPQRGIYLEFAGYSENGRVTATRLQRSLGWVGTCAERPTNIPTEARLWAAGNEPSWRFVLDGKGASLLWVDGELMLPARQLLEAGGTVAYATDSGAGLVRVEFSRGLCSDTMAEAAFGYRVVAAAKGHFYTGCGLVR
jgi:uncharacterized membrane protein